MPLCPFLPERRGRPALAILGAVYPGFRERMGQCFSNRDCEQMAPRSLQPLPQKGGAPGICVQEGAQNFPPFQGAIPASVSRGCQRTVVLISFESLIRTGLLNKASFPSTSSPASNCILLLQPHPGIARGSLNISLPEVAIVRQLVGLAGGALDHFVGDA